MSKIKNIFAFTFMLIISERGYSQDERDHTTTSTTREVLSVSTDSVDVQARGETLELQKSTVCLFVHYAFADENRIQFLEDCFRNLLRNSVGLRLVEQIQALLSSKHHLVIVRETSGGHGFSPPKKQSSDTNLYIDINFNSLGNLDIMPVSRVGCVGFLRSIKDMNFFEIGSMEYPFHITLGHELIHLLHYLENDYEYLSRKNRYDFSLWPGVNLDVHDTERGNLLWQNLEEQLTVIGDQSAPERIS